MGVMNSSKHPLQSPILVFPSPSHLTQRPRSNCTGLSTNKSPKQSVLTGITSMLVQTRPGFLPLSRSQLVRPRLRSTRYLQLSTQRFQLGPFSHTETSLQHPAIGLKSSTLYLLIGPCLDVAANKPQTSKRQRHTLQTKCESIST
jgi:hypothetical protein